MRDLGRCIPLLLALLCGACSLTKTAFQVDPCLVPDTEAIKATQPSFLVRCFRSSYVQPLTEKELLDPYGGPNAPRMTKEERNNTLEHVVQRCDQICANHKSGFTSQSILTKLFLGVTGIGLSAAGSLTTAGAANVLSAAATATQGTDKAISKDVYQDKVVTAISSSIDADQAQKLQLIREHEAESDPAQYPIWAGLRDVQKYHESCSFSVGLGLLQDNASNTKEEAETAKANKERELMQGRFTSDASGTKLRAFWKPDGHTIDASNQTRLKTWMRDNHIDSSVTFFLDSDVFASARERAAADLLGGGR